MDFIFGSEETEKTTCLLEIANQYIIDNKINKSNGYIILFTPPLSEDFDNPNNNKGNKKIYIFNQYLTNYEPNAKKNMDLIKPYTLNSAAYAFGLINNFIEISKKSSGLKLILIDDITKIIYPWINEEINKKIISAKPEEKKYYDNNINYLLIYNEIFRYFLFQINSLQKSLGIPCFISLNINISESAHFAKNSPRIFNAIFSFVKNIFYLSKSDDGTIKFRYLKLILDQKYDKIIYNLINEENNNDNNSIGDNILEEYIKKNSQNQNLIHNKIYNKEWIKKSIFNFVENINKFKIYQRQIEINKKENDSSYSQYEK